MEQFQNLNIRDDSDITRDVLSKLHIEDHNENEVNDAIMENEVSDVIMEDEVNDVVMDDYNPERNEDDDDYKQHPENINVTNCGNNSMDTREADVTMDDPETDSEVDKQEEEKDGDHSVLYDVLFNPTMQGCKLASGRDFLPKITRTNTAKSEAHKYKEEGVSTEANEGNPSSFDAEVGREEANVSEPEETAPETGETTESEQHFGDEFAIGSRISREKLDESECGENKRKPQGQNGFSFSREVYGNNHNDFSDYNRKRFSNNNFSSEGPRIYINQNNFFRDYDDYAAFRSGLRRRRSRVYSGESNDIEDENRSTNREPMWKAPYLLSTYLQLLLNTVIASCLLYQGYLFLKVIKQDVSISVDNRIMDADYRIEDCRYNYEINKCKIRRLPALEKQCTEWEKCMRKKPYMMINYSELIVSIVGSLINSFIESFGLKSFGFFALAALFLYAWNFSCGYVRAKTFYGSHLVRDGSRTNARKAIEPVNSKQIVQSEHGLT